MVVVVADGMGRPDVATCGYPLIKTPNRNRLAAQGVKLTQCDAACGGSTGGLRGGKRTDCEGGARVPGPARWPGYIGPANTSDAPVTGSNVFATVVDNAGLALPTDRTVDSVSMIPALSGKQMHRKVPMFWRTHVSPPEQRVAMRVGDRKVVSAGTLTGFQRYEVQKD